MPSVLLGFLPLAAAQQIMKAVPLGQPLPVETLFPAPVIQALTDSHYNETHAFFARHYLDDAPKDLDSGTSESRDLTPPLTSEYLPYEVLEERSLVPRGDDLVKRAPSYRGTCKMNCKQSPQACQNACYYQNCIMGGQRVRYTEPGNIANRAQAGVAVTEGTPCQTWPFGQKFWDVRENGSTTNLRLQTDEWPMASMQRANFDPSAAIPQVALRCIPRDDNSRGGNQITRCRRGIGEWKAGGRFASDRLGSGDFYAGDEYDVEFYLDDLDQTNATELAIYNTLSYCKPQPNCQNDGLQFHLTGLQLNPSGSNGKIASRYDNALHNTYRLTGQPTDVRQFHISLDITGQASDDVLARVYVLNNGAEDELARRNSANMAKGGSFTLPASNTLPKAIRVDRQTTGCTGFNFTYGDPVADGIRAFAFASQDKGWPKWALNDGKYCITEDIPKRNQQGNSIGTRLSCSFPAW